MRKLTNYFFIALAAVMMVFTSCSDEDSDPLGPNITFKAGDGLITGDETIKEGEVASFSWEAVKGDANLESFTIRIDNQDVPGFPNEDIDKDEYQATWDTTLAVAGEYTFAFIVEDKDGLTDTKTITVTVEENPIALSEYTAVIMGAQGATAGSTASLETGVVYAISGDEAKNNSDKVDIVYYYGVKEAALYSPSNADIQGVSAYDITNWGTKNATKLSESTLTSSDFTDIATNHDLRDLGTPSDDLVGLLSVDDVILFETASGKKGVFQVTEINSGTDGSITISVKVEQ